MTTALGAVACLVGLLVVAAVAWRRSRLDHADLDERLADLSARPIPAWLADLTDPELPIFAATVADFPGVVFTPQRIKALIEASSLGTPAAKAARAAVSDETVARIMARVRELDAADACPTCGATGTDGCRTVSGRATGRHRGRAS